MNTDYLPEMTMPKEEPEPSPEEDNDPLVSKADDSEGAITVDIQDREDITEEVEEEVEEEEEPVEPVVKQKRKLKNEEVFRTPTIQPVKEPKKKRKPPTEKQLQALARARESRKIAREEAKKMKAEGKEPPPSKRQQKQEKEVKEVIQKQGQIYSEEQVAKITADAIEKYDMKRKARKVEKQKKKEEEEQQRKVKQTLNRALGNADPNDIFAYALQGMYGN